MESWKTYYKMIIIEYSQKPKKPKKKQHSQHYKIMKFSSHTLLSYKRFLMKKKKR